MTEEFKNEIRSIIQRELEFRRSVKCSRCGSRTAIKYYMMYNNQIITRCSTCVSYWEDDEGIREVSFADAVAYAVMES